MLIARQLGETHYSYNAVSEGVDALISSLQMANQALQAGTLSLSLADASTLGVLTSQAMDLQADLANVRNQLTQQGGDTGSLPADLQGAVDHLGANLAVLGTQAKALNLGIPLPDTTNTTRPQTGAEALLTGLKVVGYSAVAFGAIYLGIKLVGLLPAAQKARAARAERPNGRPHTAHAARPAYAGLGAALRWFRRPGSTHEYAPISRAKAKALVAERGVKLPRPGYEIPVGQGLVLVNMSGSLELNRPAA